jgi:hypothetical protein
VVPDEIRIAAPKAQHAATEGLLDALSQVDGDFDLGLVKLLDQAVNLLLDDGLLAHPPVGIGERVIVGDHLSDAVIVQLALDQFFEVPCRRWVRVKPPQ